MTAKETQPVKQTDALPVEALQTAFGERLRLNEPLARYTSSRVGGRADAMLRANSSEELAVFVARLWEIGAPFVILGGGSNVLISDAGVREVVILNRARSVRFDETANPPAVWAEAGANLGAIARQAAARGLSGLEWAGGIPGTVGGAVVGNAGAHGSDLASVLVVAEILHQSDWEDATLKPRREKWTAEDMHYQYRSSVLKANYRSSWQPYRQGNDVLAVVLSALLRLERRLGEGPEAVQARMDAFNGIRRKTQPPGASMGSMFKNPPGDFAGRLIEAAGLKGVSVGDAQISQQHANFFVNHGKATASDIYQLTRQAQKTVLEKFGVELALEIELVGDWAGTE